MQDSKMVVAYIIGAVILTFIYKYLKHKKKEREIFEYLDKNWGIPEKKKKYDFKLMEAFFRSLNISDYTIDKITWKDLCMNEVYKIIDCTKSTPGRDYLHYIFRRPLFSKEDMDSRVKIFDSICKEKKRAQEIQYSLLNIGLKQKEVIIDLIKKEMEPDKNLKLAVNIMKFMPIYVGAIFLINKGAFLPAIPILVMGNYYLSEKVKSSMYSEMGTFLYINRIISAAEKVASKEFEPLKEDIAKLKILLENVKELKKKTSAMKIVSGTGEMDVIVVALNILFLVEASSFFKSIKLLKEHRKDLEKIYKIVGKIDAHICIASYLEKNNLCKVEFSEDRKVLNFTNISNPLLKSPVVNDLDFNNKSILLTGSNASGKSTFLRSVGINQVLAQTIGYNFSGSYRTSFFKIYSSITLADDILEGDSYFVAESKAIKRIIENKEENVAELIILDEIFRGTNTIDRISAAKYTLEYLSRGNLVIAATHDIELTKLLVEHYDNYHFKEEIEEKDIKFDYKLKVGAAQTRNAIEILRIMDFPEEIYIDAKEMSKKIEEGKLEDICYKTWSDKVE